MKLLMDADCLIKLTKAGLKEFVCRRDTIVIPDIVKYEVVDAGKAKNCDDAFVVEKNISKNFISIVNHVSDYAKGDSALIDLFPKGNYDAVATDDAKLIRRLRTFEIPFILPGLIIYRFLKDDHITKIKAIQALNQLAEFISKDEFSTVRLLMEKIK
jgi:rRNA-processing protein FCF1